MPQMKPECKCDCVDSEQRDDLKHVSLEGNASDLPVDMHGYHTIDDTTVADLLIAELTE